MSTADRRKDVKLLGWLFGAIVVLLIAIALLQPRATEDDARPTTANNGSQGARAAFLTLQAMGRTAVSWDEDSAHLALLDAPRSTLVLAEPDFSFFEQKTTAERLKTFMERGGRVLLTGAKWASVLPDGQAEAPGGLAPKLCDTTPEGAGALAAVGPVQMADEGTWSARGPQFRAEQRCVGKPVVVRFPVGEGEAVWWSSATPLTNAGLKNDSDLRLLLASIGQGRVVYFDQYYFGEHPQGEEHPLRGLPIHSLLWQLALLFALVVWSFSRRKGPLRLPAAVPRSSPVEFAQSMGGLYGKARATEPVLEAAQRRLERVLTHEAGLSHEVVRSGPEAVAETLTLRFGGNWSDLRLHLQQARSARGGAVTPRDALALVKAIAGDEERLRRLLAPGVHAARAGTMGAPSVAVLSRRVGTAASAGIQPTHADEGAVVMDGAPRP